MGLVGFAVVVMERNLTRAIPRHQNLRQSLRLLIKDGRAQGVVVQIHHLVHSVLALVAADNGVLDTPNHLNQPRRPHLLRQHGEQA